MDPYTRPDPARSAVLTIDVQNDFTLPGAPAEIDGTAAVVPRIVTVLEAARDARVPIVHVVRLYRTDGSNVDRCRRGAIESGEEVVRPGSAGAELVAELRPDGYEGLDADRLLDGAFQQVGPREWVTYKPRWGAFYRTGLEAFLDDRGVNTVVATGCNFPNCPRTTVYEASERDYRIRFVADATSGTYERGLDELRDVGVAVADAAGTAEWLATA
jgi:nicotinamidase-related amidase